MSGSKLEKKPQLAGKAWKSFKKRANNISQVLTRILSSRVHEGHLPEIQTETDCSSSVAGDLDIVAQTKIEANNPKPKQHASIGKIVAQVALPFSNETDESQTRDVLEPRLIVEQLLFDQCSADHTNTPTIDDTWKIAVSSSLDKRNSIDREAEEFIFKFREELRLQKERSGSLFDQCSADHTTTIDDAWTIAVSSSLDKMNSIDREAEEFISIFHEELRLQKERSEPLFDQCGADHTNTPTIDDAWTISVSSSLDKMNSIDREAEEFISKFREKLRLQKEISDLE